MKRATLTGVRIAQGPSDWQIVQRRLDNQAEMPVGGTWLGPENRMGTVEIRLVDETFQQPVAARLDWQDADTSPDHTWRHVIADIPAGGLYRVETRLRVEGDNWRWAGDQIHHLGVGDLWIVAGDDNALGFGLGMAEDPCEFGVHVFRRNELWALASHPIHDATGIRNSRFFANGSAGHSPWLAFGRLLRRETGLPIGILPAAQEGLPLDAWQGKNKAAATPAFDNLLVLVKTASSFRDYSAFSLLDGGPLFLPKPDCPPGIVAGMVWFHGNADTRREGAAAKYSVAFAQFVDKIRNSLESPGLPIIVCQINRVAGLARPTESNLWGKVREAQRAAGHDIADLAVIPTLDAGLSDGIHTSAQGNVLIGQRAGRAALGMVYGKKAPCKAPDFLRASFAEERRNKVLLEFADVSGELRPVTAEISSLSFADATGGAPIRKVQLIRPNKILTTLNRDLGENPTIGFCAHHNPPLAFLDNNNCPPLAFANIAIEETT